MVSSWTLGTDSGSAASGSSAGSSSGSGFAGSPGTNGTGSPSGSGTDGETALMLDKVTTNDGIPYAVFTNQAEAPNNTGVDVYYEGYGFKEGVGSHSYLRYVDRSTGNVYVGRGGPAKDGQGVSYPDGKYFGNVLLDKGFSDIKLKGFELRDWASSSEARRISQDGLKIIFSQHLATLNGGMDTARAQYNDFAARVTGLDATYLPLSFNSNTFAAAAAINLFGADPRSLPPQYGTGNLSLIRAGVDPANVYWGVELPVGAP